MAYGRWSGMSGLLVEIDIWTRIMFELFYIHVTLDMLVLVQMPNIIQDVECYIKTLNTYGYCSLSCLLNTT